MTKSKEETFLLDQFEIWSKATDLDFTNCERYLAFAAFQQGARVTIQHLIDKFGSKKDKVNNEKRI